MSLVVIYARYSSDLQRTASIEDQIRLCQERVAREGWTTFKCYTDRAMSGASLMRPGIQLLIHDAVAGRFHIVLAESLDRLSRDLENIAGLYKKLAFAGVRIVTVSEGEIADIHVGLKGTMAALFLKDLADKTRRGIRGRIEAGKSGGGNSYGYNVVRQFGPTGDAVRGDRIINPAQAAIVQRIFTEYSQGVSPRTIAVRLNQEGIPGPHGPWGATTIHGHRTRGTGIINNELYVGRIVWNRLRYIKDPATGKRVSRINPPSQWVRRKAPHLRIISDELWEVAQARQAQLSVHTRTDLDRLTDRRRPRHIFSGLLRCGSCEGSFIKISAEHYGCATARNKGTCDCRAIVRQDKLEETVLRGLQHHLMKPEYVEPFAEEYTRRINQLRMERSADKARMTTELAKVLRDIDRYLQAILEGVPGSQIKDRMIALEERKLTLQREIRNTPDEPTLIHPNMAHRYRQQVAELRQALNDQAHRDEAIGIIRSLMQRIVVSFPNGMPTVELEGELAGILGLAFPAKAVAGPRNQF